MRGSDYMMGTQPLRKMKASHLMEEDVVSFTKEESCDHIIQAMEEGGFGGVPIIDEHNRLIGIVSEFDLLNGILAGMDMVHLKAGEIMQHPYSVSVDCPSMEICRLFQENHLIRAPVVDDYNRVVGIVSRRDILKGYLEEKMGPPLSLGRRAKWGFSD